MIGPGAGARVMVATRPVDFRKGPDALAALVGAEYGGDPYSGVIYVFRTKRSDRVKPVCSMTPIRRHASSNQCRRCLRTSGRSCSIACPVFFACDPVTLEEVMHRPDPDRRWGFERTFGWMTRWRRLVCDYEERIDVSQAMILVAMGANMLRQNAHP